MIKIKKTLTVLSLFLSISCLSNTIIVVKKNGIELKDDFEISQSYVYTIDLTKNIIFKYNAYQEKYQFKKIDKSKKTIKNKVLFNVLTRNNIYDNYKLYNHINNFEVINISYFWNISVIVDGVLIREINYRNYMPKYFYENIKSLIENESRYEEYLTKPFYELNKASLIPCHLDETVSIFEIEPYLFKLNLFQIKNPKEVDIIKLEKFKFEQFYQVLLPNICYEKEDVLLSIGKLKNKYYFIFSSGKVLKFKGPV